jgi:glycerophosphoryl diester phosphodiesterase
MTGKRRFAVAVLAAVALGWGAQPAAAQDPSDEELIALVRAGLAVLDDFAERPACDQQPDPARWANASPPDQGSANPVISAHRGAIELAPENTVWSYEYAFAYGVDLVEVDVQQTVDGRFVALHDSTVDRTTDGTGEISDLTYAQVRALNAADYEPWKGSEFDPAQVASLEEVLALAARVGGGLELDIKGSVTEEGRLAELVKRYGLIEESIFNTGDVRVFQAAPNANLIYNRDTFEPPFLIYEIGRVFSVFGSRLDEYSAEAIAAAHDACAIVMPHAYDAGPDQEVAQFQAARAIGADGVQTNQPDEIVAAAGLPAPARLDERRGDLCLTNARNRLGFPAKEIELRKGWRTGTLTTGIGGCVEIPGAEWKGAHAAFAGDGSVVPARTKVR